MRIGLKKPLKEEMFLWVGLFLGLLLGYIAGIFETPTLRGLLDILIIYNFIFIMMIIFWRYGNENNFHLEDRKAERRPC